MDPKGKLSWLERISYGLGDYAGNLVYSAISAFLLVYYTECVGMSAGVAASVMAVSKVFDGISDLIMGRVVDRTHTKWGKARPWIIRASIPLAICTVLMFSVPEGAVGGMQAAYAFITYNLVSTVFYTMLNVPYASLQGLMTVNQYERGILGNIRMLLATFGTMTINTVVPILTGAFGGTGSRHAWTMTMIILMIAFLIINSMTFFFCKERVVDETADESEDNKDKKAKNGPSVWACLKSLLVNKYWVLMVIFLFALYFMMSTFFGGNYYFAQYVLESEGSYSLLSNVLSIAQMAVMFVTPVVMIKMKKRTIGVIGMAAAGFGFILTALAGQNVMVVVVANIIKGIGFGCGAAVMWGMLQFRDNICLPLKILRHKSSPEPVESRPEALVDTACHIREIIPVMNGVAPVIQAERPVQCVRRAILPPERLYKHLLDIFRGIVIILCLIVDLVADDRRRILHMSDERPDHALAVPAVIFIRNIKDLARPVLQLSAIRRRENIRTFSCEPRRDRVGGRPDNGGNP